MPHQEIIDDRNVHAIRRLAPPDELRRALPLSEQAERLVAETRAEIRGLVRGDEDDRLLVVVGPCSINDPDSTIEYAQRLKPVADETRDKLLVVMRTYFEKPRTTVGWKGLLNDPHLDGTCDVETGVTMARELLISIAEVGLPCGGELLDPISPQYLSDLYTWAAVGARTVESQTHRELASGASMPVGLKNATDGSIDAAANALVAARAPHSFLGIDLHGRASVVETKGNPDCHLILRGGSAGTNFDGASIARADELSSQLGRSVMVDCSHANSGKDHRAQAKVARTVVSNSEARQQILGLMLESNLLAGRQDWSPGQKLVRGVSITDACIGWEETRDLLHEIAHCRENR